MAVLTLNEDVAAQVEFRRYQKVKNFFQLRNSRYKFLLNILGGNFYSNDLITTVPVTGEQATEIAQTTGRQLVVNRLAVVVRNFKDFLSEPPEIDVPPRRDKKGKVTPEADEHADTIKKLLYATWAANQMEMELQAVEHYTSGLGSAPIRVWPDLGRKLMTFTVVRPWTFYPMPYGDDFRKMRYVCVENPVSGEELLAEYGASFTIFNPEVPRAIDPDETYLVVDYFTNEVHSRIFSVMPNATGARVGERVTDESPLYAAGPQTIYRVKNLLGYVPFLNIPGNYIPHQSVGESDIEQGVGLMYYINDMLQTQADIMAFTGNPILVITGTSLAPSSIPNHPGAGVAIPEPGAKVQFLTPPNVSAAYFDQIRQVMQMIEDQTTQPSPVQGRVQPGIRSGAAIQALLGSMAALVSTKQRTRKMFYGRLNEMLLTGYEKVFGDTELDLQGSLGFTSGEYFSLKMKGKAIDGWHANEIIYREGLQDYSARLQVTTEKLRLGLISKRTARRDLGVRSPIEEEAQIRAEAEELARLQRAAQPQPSAPTARPGIPPALTPGLLGQMGGPVGQAPPTGGPGGMPPGPGGPMGMPAGPGGPMAESGPGDGAAGMAAALGGVAGPSVDEEAVREAIRSVPLAGKVYLISADQRGIRLVVTRAADKPKLEEALGRFGVPVSITINGQKPEGATRIRGK